MDRSAKRQAVADRRAQVEALLDGDAQLAERFKTVRKWSGGIRVSEYHLTNACNIRCKGCWFFEYGHDKTSREETSLAALEAFVRKETERKVNCALLIGGEPTLFPERVGVFTKWMKYVTISTNGLRKLPREGFEKVNVAVTLFGGGPLDDELRGIKPSGQHFGGLLDTALGHYKNDDRVIFIYAVTRRGLRYIEETVRKIADNGNKVNFNYYSEYGTRDPLRVGNEAPLLEECLRMKEKYPDTVVGHPYYISALVTGRSHWGEFGYEVCPSLSVDHPAHEQRLVNGNPHLPFFNTYSADLKTVQFCCTSGHCDGCRDSQAVFSWLLVSLEHFLVSKDKLRLWVELAESYWKQFYWSPYAENDRLARGPQADWTAQTPPPVVVTGTPLSI